MPIYIIAEIGINHNGSMKICKELISLAHSAGCNAVKFQKRDIDTVYTQEFLSMPRESPWGTTQRDQKMGLELGEEDYREISDFCKDLGIDWFVSCWDTGSQKTMRKFGTPYNKVASPMIVDQDLLKEIASEGKHTFISTGMSELEQIDEAVRIFRESKCSFELMHCVSTYPMRDEEANLQCIQTLRDRYDCNIGYSGHEVGLSISYAAAALGISSLERHITLDRAMYGSDQAASIGPEGLRQLVGGIRKIESAMGDGIKRVTSGEKTIAERLRGHILSS